MGLINDEQLEKLANNLTKSGYGNYLLKILKDKNKIHLEIWKKKFVELLKVNI